MTVIKIVLGLISLGVTCVSAQKKPNIIFILADDLGYGEVGVLWQNARTTEKKIKTPHIDQMAKEGMILNRHYCPAPVCAPSRGSLLTGLHQGHANVRDNQFDKALENNYNLANTLKKAGYFTAIIGKYGLQGEGGSPESWAAYPTKRGFDYFFGYVTHKAGHTHYPSHVTTKEKSDLYKQDQNISADLTKCFTPDLFTARAKKLITDEVNDGDEQPFFIYLAYDTPHAALQLPTTAYPGSDVNNPTNISGFGLNGGVQWLGKPGQMINTAVGEIDSYRHPDHTTNVQKKWSDLEERQAGLIRRMDNNIGDLRKTLKDLRIENNTLVVFSSDNGPHSESYIKANQTRDKSSYRPKSFESYGPFIGIKRDCWEGGIREPSFVVWPDKILAGSKSEQISQFHDWLPTFCDLAGLTPPARTDGVSLVPTLTAVGKQRPTTTYIEYLGKGKTPNYPELSSHKNQSRNQSQVIFLDGYKGIRTNTKGHQVDFEIYDVSKDFKEAINLTKTSGYFKTLNQRMKDRVLQLRMPDTSAPRPWDKALIPSIKNLTDLKPGLVATTYQGDWDWVPEFTLLTPLDRKEVSSLSTTTLHTTGTKGGILFEGFIKVPSSGKWVVSIKSEAKVVLKIHDMKVIDNDFHHTSKAVTATLNLEAGAHPIRLYYTADKQTPLKLSFENQKDSSSPALDTIIYHTVK